MNARWGALSLLLAATLLAADSGCLPDMDVPVGSSTWEAYCQCKICSQPIPGGGCQTQIPDGPPFRIPQCGPNSRYLLLFPQERDQFVQNLSHACSMEWQRRYGNMPEGTPPPSPPPVQRWCDLVPVTDPAISPPELPFEGSNFLTLQRADACVDSRMSYTEPYANATAWNTRYNVGGRNSYMDLWYNRRYARVELTGAFHTQGINCYDGLSSLGITECPSILRTVELKGQGVADLGGDYVFDNINIIGVGSIFGRVANAGNNVATGSANPADVALAQTWQMAGPGEQNGYLYVTADQVPMGNRRVGAVAGWQSRVGITVNYRERLYEVSGAFDLPNGYYGYLRFVGSTNNQLPVADAGFDQTVCREAGVTLSGRFLDPDSDNVWHHVGWYNYNWELLAWDNLKPHLQLPIGTHYLILMVWDQALGTGMDVVKVEVLGC